LFFDLLDEFVRIQCVSLDGYREGWKEDEEEENEEQVQRERVFRQLQYFLRVNELVLLSKQCSQLAHHIVIPLFNFLLDSLPVRFSFFLLEQIQTFQ
jgi:hypothetical protein